MNQNTSISGFCFARRSSGSEVCFLNGDFRKGSHFLVLMLLTYVWVIFECAFRHLCFLYDLSVRQFETLGF